MAHGLEPIPPSPADHSLSSLFDRLAEDAGLYTPITAADEVFAGPPVPEAPLEPIVTSIDEPPPEPPGTRVRSQGLPVWPYALFSVDDPMANSSMFVFPSRTTPATCLRRIRRNPLYENFNDGSARVIVCIDRIISESGKREIKRLDESARCKVVGDDNIAA